MHYYLPIFTVVYFFPHHFWCPFILLKWLRQLLSALQNETETCFLFDVTWLMYFDNALADIWKKSWLFCVLQKVFFFFFLINLNVHHPLNLSSCCFFFFSLHRAREMLCKSIETPLISLFCFQWVKLFSYFFMCSWAIVLQAFWWSFKAFLWTLAAFPLCFSSVLVPDNFQRIVYVSVCMYV